MAAGGRMRPAPERGSRGIRVPELLQNRSVGAHDGFRTPFCRSCVAVRA